ncbi:MAG: serine/threonine protein kinase [Deltaproteobacteria bacterium]|nr:serine/threonine protein kinase [Deltaproteobacteria bacterium]
MLNPGQEIGAYVVEALTGSGGTAVVYRVRHRVRQSLHALKVLSVTSETIRDRMVQEGEVQASLHHPNVVAVNDVVDVHGDPGLVMEFIEGPALDEAMQQYRLDPRAAEALFLGILSGVRHAHAFGLVHRDLKPANVLLARTAGGFVPKVTDFGLAKVLDNGDADVGRTRAGVAMGTPAYMAPEQIRDARTVDQRADIFSLGCLLYELFTHQRAFSGQQALAVYNAVIDGAYLSPRELVPDLDPRVENAIQGCLIVEREERIPDCETLGKVLRGDLRWQIPDHPDSYDLDPDPTTATVPLDAPALLIAGAADTGTLTVASPIRPAGAPHAPRGRGLRWAIWGVGAAGLIGLVALGVSLWGIKTLLQEEAAGTAPVPAAPIMVQGTPPAPSTAEVPAPSAPQPGAAPAGRATQPVPQQAPPQSPSAAPEKPPAPEEVPPPQTPRAPSGKATAAAAQITAKVLSVPPTAELEVDGISVGRTPSKLPLSEGFHEIRVKVSDQEGRFSLHVRAGGENKWCYAFAEGKAYEGSCPR